MYELLPFGMLFLTNLGFEVITSPIEDKTIYRLGQKYYPR